MNPYQPAIKTSSVPSLHCSIRRTSLLMLTLGSAPSSPSSPYCLPHVQMRTKRSLQPNNSVALPASGGIIIRPCSLPVISSLGTSFGPLFERTTSPKDSLSEISMNLTQGTRTVLQYAQVFNHLCQYAGYHADNDARKQDRFR
jgi:hypothetical protein